MTKKELLEAVKNETQFNLDLFNKMREARDEGKDYFGSISLSEKNFNYVRTTINRLYELRNALESLLFDRFYDQAKRMTPLEHLKRFFDEALSKKNEENGLFRFRKEIISIKKHVEMNHSILWEEERTAR